MIKKIFTLLLICLTQIIFSQETILEFKNDLKASSSDIKDVIPIINEETGEIVFFVADAKNIYAYKFNENFEVIDKMISENKERKFKKFVGHSISDNGDYNLYLQNKSFTKKFLEVMFSFETKKVKLKKFSLNNSINPDSFQENYVKCISHQNKFYVISSISNKKGFIISSFNENKEFVSNIIGANKQDFLSKKQKPITVGKLFYNKRLQISLIDKNVPYSIEMVSEPIKIYKEKKSLIFSFDNNPLYTQLLTVNLIDFSSEFVKFAKPMQQLNHNKKTNSFLFEDKIILLATFSKGLQLNIVDSKSRKITKDFKIYSNDSIKFKNTPIIQEGGMYSGYRELESTKKFLRKINSGKVGVSFRKRKDGNYHMVLGGYKEQKRAPMPMGGFGGIPIASFSGLTMSINPTMFAFNSYTNSKSTRFESLIDNNFNHIEGKVSENAFDKINSFDKGEKSEIKKTNTIKKPRGSNSSFTQNSSANSVFKYKDYFIKSYYKTSSKTFTFKKFTEE